MEVTLGTCGPEPADVCGAPVGVSHSFMSSLRYVHNWDKTVLADATNKLYWACALGGLSMPLLTVSIGSCVC